MMLSNVGYLVMTGVLTFRNAKRRARLMYLMAVLLISSSFLLF
jgi:hypothetical protein